MRKGSVFCRSSAPGNGRRTGKPAPSKELVAVATCATGRVTPVAPATVGTVVVSVGVTAGMVLLLGKTLTNRRERRFRGNRLLLPIRVGSDENPCGRKYISGEGLQELHVGGPLLRVENGEVATEHPVGARLGQDPALVERRGVGGRLLPAEHGDHRGGLHDDRLDRLQPNRED